MSNETENETLVAALCYVGVVCTVLVAGKVVIMAANTSKKIRANRRAKKAEKQALKVVEHSFSVA